MLKVPTADRRWIKRTTGTTDMETARAIAKVIEALDNKAAFGVLDRISAKEQTLTLAELLAHWRATPKRVVKGVQVTASDDECILYVQEQVENVDLSPLVAEWNGAGRRKGKSTADGGAKYLKQVRRFIPAGKSFPRGKFTTMAIFRFLSQLTTPQTQRRYAAAIAAFGAWLVQAGIIDANPANQLELPEIGDQGDPVFLDEDEAKRVIASMPLDQAALEALMFGSAIEWQAAERLTAANFDIPNRLVFANGGKTRWRRRWVEVTEDWCWDIVLRYLRTLSPNAKFVTKCEQAALGMHSRRCVSLSVTETTLHQYRHAFAVMWLKRGAAGGLRSDGRNEAWLKNQLGHSPRSTLLFTRYGVYITEFALRARQEERRANETRPHDRPQLTAMK